MDYTAVPGAEQAHIYRDKLRSLELRHVQLKAAQLAGEDVSDSEVEDLETKMKLLSDAANEAERADRRAAGATA